MASPSYAELEELASAFPGENKSEENLAAKANSPISDLEYREFASLKLKCDKVEAWYWRQDDFGRNDPDKTADKKVSEFRPPPPEAWETVLDKSKELLKASKDSKLALIFCVASSYRHGFEGLRDSLLFLKLLFNNVGLALQPQAKPVGSLSAKDKKRQIIATLGPIFRAPRLMSDSLAAAHWPASNGEKPINLHAWKVIDWVSEKFLSLSSDQQKHFATVLSLSEPSLLPNSKKFVEGNLRAVSPESSRKTIELLDSCKTLAKEVGELIFNELCKLIDETSGDKNTEDLKKEKEQIKKELDGFNDISSGVNIISATLSSLLPSTLEPPQSDQIDGGQGGGDQVSSSPQSTTGTAIPFKRGDFMASGNQDNRAEALKALASVKKFFEQTEPHSIIPFILERALRWGNMPMDKVMFELLGDNKAAMHALWERANVRIKEDASDQISPPPPTPAGYVANYSPPADLSPSTTSDTSSDQPINQADLFG